MACQCAENWRLELVWWGTGDVLSVIVPESFEFESDYQVHGRGTVTFKMQGILPPLSSLQVGTGTQRINQVPLFNAYPGDIGIVINRVTGPGADWDGQRGMFAGIIETLTVDSGGLVSVGLNEITEFLTHRVLRDQISVSGMPQTEIAAGLVNYAYFGNFAGQSDDEWIVDQRTRLFGEDLGSSINRTRTYGDEENPRPVLWDLLKNLMQLSNGPEYRLRITKTANAFNYLVFMQFADSFQTEVKTVHWEDVVDATLLLENRERASLVEVFGRDNQIVTRTLADADPALEAAKARYLRYDTTVQYDVRNLADLQEYGDGVVLDQHDAAGVLRLQFEGLEYSPSLTINDFVPGNAVNVIIDNDSVPWQFRGGPDIPIPVGVEPLFVDDLKFGRVAISAPNDGPERVSVDLITSKPFLPIEYPAA